MHYDSRPDDPEHKGDNGGGETETILSEREKTHGPYPEKCAVIQAIMRITEPYHHKLNDVQMVSHTMIIHKMARYLTGDPNCADHWDDIKGYRRLPHRLLKRRP
jgi:hypothetical protein